MEVDDVMGEQGFVFKGQTNIVQPSVIGADRNVYSRIKTAIEDNF
jgi:hypothetical protein